MKGKRAKTKLNTNTLYDSIVKRQLLQHYPNLNHVFNMLIYQLEVRGEELQLDLY